jgi:hypothetical protein
MNRQHKHSSPSPRRNRFAHLHKVRRTTFGLPRASAIKLVGAAASRSHRSDWWQGARRHFSQRIRVWIRTMARNAAVSSQARGRSIRLLGGAAPRGGAGHDYLNHLKAAGLRRASHGARSRLAVRRTAVAAGVRRERPRRLHLLCGRKESDAASRCMIPKEGHMTGAWTEPRSSDEAWTEP